MSAAPVMHHLQTPRHLVDLRLDQGLGRHRLSKRAGVSISTLYSIERGGHRMKPETARLLADALGILPMQILEYATQRETDVAGSDSGLNGD